MEKEYRKFRWFLIKAKTRLLYSVIVGVLAFLLLEGHHTSTRFLMAWTSASLVYLVSVFLMMQYFNKRNISHLGNHHDEGQSFIYIVSLLASAVSLTAIFIHVGGIPDIPLKDRILSVMMTGITFFISWLVLHTAYSLHYAHAYYATLKEDAEFPPLIFVGNRFPSYSELFHFSIVIGMTCQTADIVIVDPKIRSLVTTHSLLSFVFNATLLGLTMSLVGGLLA
jgi:uncharacterized membrane protein